MCMQALWMLMYILFKWSVTESCFHEVVICWKSVAWRRKFREELPGVSSAAQKLIPELEFWYPKDVSPSPTQ